jgi:hypothetical protein
VLGVWGLGVRLREDMTAYLCMCVWSQVRYWFREGMCIA